MSVVEAGTVSTPYVYGEELLQAASDALAGTTGGTIERALIVHDIPSVDCEMLAVIQGPITMRSVDRRSELGASHAHKMGWLNLVTYKILVARDCHPIGDDQGNAPTPTQLRAAMRRCSEDVWAIWHHITLSMAAGNLFAGACSELFMDNAVPLPVAGGIAGWTITMRAGVPGYIPGS